MKTSVLFLCTGNSCRSQMAEAVLRHRYGDRFASHSSGSAPDLSRFPDTSGVHPLALDTLRRNGVPIEGLHSKLWDPYVKGEVPVQIVITLCGSAKDELNAACPVFPGRAITAHWGVDDPSHVMGTPEEIDRAFQTAFETIGRRIGALADLTGQSDELSADQLKKSLREIGEIS